MTLIPPWVKPGPPFLYAALALGLLLDRLYSWHSGVLLRLHPVHTGFVLARRLAPPGSSRARGAVAWLAVMTSHLAVAALLLYASWLVSPLAWVAVAAVIVKLSCPLYPLLDAASRFYRCASRGDWECGRRYAQWLVRRNVRLLDEPHVVSAVLESLAESLVDGYTSPILYYMLLGPLGALAQRMVNTLDSALGYLDEAYREAGWLSARADDVVNYIPARLTALAIVAASCASSLGCCSALSSWLRWSGETLSPNAGHPMAALAGALGVWLEKPGFYRLNPGGREPRVEDVPLASRLVVLAALLYTAALTPLAFIHL